MRFYNANYMKDCLMVWAVFRSQHTNSNNFNIWKDCQRVVSVLKKITTKKKLLI